MSQIIVLNAGGQYCHLIARRVRELGVHSSVMDIDAPISELSQAAAIIVSGGPRSVREAESPHVDRRVYELGKPILGICYGHQLLARDLDGEVVPGVSKEYGEAKLEVITESVLLGDLPKKSFTVWMSHGDTVMGAPEGFDVVAGTQDCKVAAMEDVRRRFFGVQFHPEVSHTAFGKEILRRFVVDVAGCVKDWDPRRRVDHLIDQIGTQAKGKRVFFLVSGGIDSTVAFHLCVRALGPDCVRGLFVDTGFMRKGEAEQVRSAMLGVPPETLHFADRSADFLKELDNATNPEEKRRRIGDLFMRVQEEEFAKLDLQGGDWLLGQGTIYPDTIESGGTKHSAKIKTHHNRVERVLELMAAGRVIEPLVEFYKDEVRMVAEELGLPADVVNKHPFPGPGLAIRCLCARREVAVERMGRELSATIGEGAGGWSVPLRTVGVQGDERSYAQLMVIQGVSDLVAGGMAARRITNDMKWINRVAVLLHAEGDAGLDGFKIHPALLSRSRLELLREVDAAVTRLLKDSGAYSLMWQCPVGLLPLGRRAAGETVIVRPVQSRDGMTAEFVPLPANVVAELQRIVPSIAGVEALLYDVTNKPPATIELE